MNNIPVLARVLMIFILCQGMFPNDLQITQAAAGSPPKTYLPLIANGPPVQTQSSLDWSQLGHDAQRTNATSQQVDPPYCYAWKWDAVSIASRAQPVIANNILVIGGMDGRLYARDATTGAPLWNYQTGGPIRHSAAIAGNFAITGSYDGYTYSINLPTGSQAWKTFTGSSATAPLTDTPNQRVFVASTNGVLTALNITNGSVLWSYDSGAAILTSPSLSADGSTVFFGNEAVKAIAVNANSGAKLWETVLQGQSLEDRYPVVSGSSVFYRSQPYYFFHRMLQTYGDDVMDQAGGINADWAADWSGVKSKILAFLNQNPSYQTFFVLNTASGSQQGTAPVLYTYGDNDVPNVPVVNKGQIFLTYRARHGIQTDGKSVHVSSKYDAELGKMDAATLDITGLRNTTPYTSTPFRMTSDEPAMLSMGGNILWVDNWERLGGINVSTGALVYAGHVSTDWPECGSQCGPGGSNPFFPLSGVKTDPAYPFPSPRVTEGHSRGGVAIANNMVYWRVIEGGLAGIKHATAACGSPLVYKDGGVNLAAAAESTPAPAAVQAATALDSYVTSDLTAPAAITSANQDLVDRLRKEVRSFLTTANGQHLMPYFLERGFSTTNVWPYNSSQAAIPQIAFVSNGNLFWQDPGELLYSMAMAYPYLDNTLQNDLKTYMTAEMNRYPPLQELPFNTPGKDWLKTGSSREIYPLTSAVRSQLNNWPPVSVNIAAIYGLWLWSKNTNDWSYASAHWANIQSLYTSRAGSLNYYSDIGGVIGYYRIADHLGKTSEKSAALGTAVAAMQAGLNFATYRDRANQKHHQLPEYKMMLKL